MIRLLAGSEPWRRKSGTRSLFLRRWLANPLRMGSVAPSSQALCQRLVRHGWPPDGRIVLELGAVTGVISKAFLSSGLPPEQLAVVEIDPALVRHLREALPGITVLAGDARDLPALLPPRLRGRIGSVICGIPLVLLPVTEQRRYIEAIADVAPGQGFLHFSYCLTSPLSARKNGLHQQREAWTAFNLPPASVWRYTPALDK